MRSRTGRELLLDPGYGGDVAGSPAEALAGTTGTDPTVGAVGRSRAGLAERSRCRLERPGLRGPGQLQRPPDRLGQRPERGFAVLDKEERARLRTLERQQVEV